MLDSKYCKTFSPEHRKKIFPFEWQIKSEDSNLAFDPHDVFSGTTLEGILQRSSKTQLALVRERVDRGEVRLDRANPAYKRFWSELRQSVNGYNELRARLWDFVQVILSENPTVTPWFRVLIDFMPSAEMPGAHEKTFRLIVLPNVERVISKFRRYQDDVLDIVETVEK
jgi:hypothetical protein